ncbi:unnamed protein product [Vitrella brassicaformis CCMP3155]|uniref:Reverse transcriptase Ty1/copia-type domain-containing protein n=2 Tax=Vitrella brassicaformis (strain CCMP3155) TaxID=1169540 RepID=A0A0G4GTU8_VITBC|nr:unnamed protein product [Vitrella brassicaformis CCMP3155]|eukprot:CEM34166.1 unnamed protein product [Vitrella brassicaformis CCMP3155]
MLYAPAVGREADAEGFKQQLHGKFGIKDLGHPERFLGMNVTYDKQEGILALSQEKYVQKLIERFNMCDRRGEIPCQGAKTPLPSGVKLSKTMEPTTKEQHDHMSKVPYREAVGSLLYSAVTLRPDIAYAVKECAMYCNCAGKRHWEAIKHIIRYLRETAIRALTFRRPADKSVKILAYADSSHADLENGRSTGGYVIYLCGNPVIWRCKNQPIVAASTTEAEYIEASECAREIVHIQQLLQAFGTKSERTTILVDNRGAQSVSYNAEMSDRTKAIRVRYHLVREKVEAGEVEVGWIPSAENVADVLTKNLPAGKHTPVTEKLFSNPSHATQDFLLPRGTRMDVESDEESDMDT